MLLRDVLPAHYFHGGYEGGKVDDLLDQQVLRRFDKSRWPGKQKHVRVFWLLKSGHLVGWNENRQKGDSFHILKGKLLDHDGIVQVDLKGKRVVVTDIGQTVYDL